MPGIYGVAVPGSPMSALPTADERAVFVSLNSSKPTEPNGVAILQCQDGVYRYVRTIPLESQPAISALTHDGKILVVPDDNFIAFVDVQRALTGTGNPILGFIEDIPNDDAGAVYAAISPDDRYAFVAEEQSSTLTVIDLQKIREGHIEHDAIVSEFLIGNGPVGLVPSADKRYLFATVQVALRKFGLPHTCKPEGSGQGETETPGMLVTIDIAKAASDPGHAIVSSVPAGCHPVRAALAPDGATLWVTARKDNAVYAFSTAKLIAGGAGARIASVSVGEAPVPIVVTPDGKYVLAGNSDRFQAAGGGSQVLDVIDAEAREDPRPPPRGRVSPPVQRDGLRLHDLPVELRIEYRNRDRS